MEYSPITDHTHACHKMVLLRTTKIVFDQSEHKSEKRANISADKQSTNTRIVSMDKG